MKLLNKIFVVLIATLPFFLGLSSCVEEAEYSSADKLSNAQVYFSNTLNSTVELSSQKTSFDIELRRVKTNEALTISLNAVDTSGLFTLPKNVTFAADSSVTKIKILYDPTKFAFDSYKYISIKFADESSVTPYGKSEYNFLVGIPAPWKSLGYAKYIDTYLFQYAYNVEIQQNLIDPTRYRLVDPFTDGLTKEGYVPTDCKGNQSKYLEFTVLPVGSKVGNVTTTINGLVMYDNYFTGSYNTTYSAEVEGRHPSKFTTKYPLESFWVHNIVTQFSSNGTPEIIQLAPYFYMNGIGGWNYTQKDGVITIVFPGVVLADYSADVIYNGRFTDADNVDYAVGSVTLGADVESAKVAMISGQSIDSAIAGIKDGSIESKKITSSGELKFPCTTTGTYSIVVVTYAGDEAKKSGFVTFDFKSTQATVGM